MEEGEQVVQEVGAGNGSNVSNIANGTDAINRFYFYEVSLFHTVTITFKKCY